MFSFPAGCSLEEKKPGGCAESRNQGKTKRRNGSKHEAIPANQFLQPIQPARWTRQDCFLMQVTLYVHCQSVGCRVTAGAVLLQALEHNPIHITAELRHQPRRFDMTPHGCLG